MRHVFIIAAMLICASAANAMECRASHYGHGDGFHGRRTASGERMNAYGYTAAMRGYMGRSMTVTNLANGRSVIVRVNDFGPAAWTGKCIDLSWGAAQAIGMGGTGRVHIQ